MNEREGHLLCTELKEMHETKHIPVIILSIANNLEEIAEKCKAEGFLNELFDLDDLLEEAERCILANSETNVTELTT